MALFGEEKDEEGEEEDGGQEDPLIHPGGHRSLSHPSSTYIPTHPDTVQSEIKMEYVLAFNTFFFGEKLKFPPIPLSYALR